MTLRIFVKRHEIEVHDKLPFNYHIWYYENWKDFFEAFEFNLNEYDKIIVEVEHD